MKKISILISIFCLSGLISCQDIFLQKPDTTGTVDLDEIYSSKQNAGYALATCYREILGQGLPHQSFRDSHGTYGSISGERGRGYSWHPTFTIVSSGFMPTGNSNQPEHHYDTNWSAIRKCYLVKENIDRVPDMTEPEKEQVKGEVTALIAYRYMGMFIRFGGLQIIEKAYFPGDDLSQTRQSVDSTYKFIMKLCDEALELLPDVRHTGDDNGHMTRGVVMAIKARTAMFAARPLFNSSSPYLSLGENDDLICFGNQDDSRWQTAIDYNLEALAWAEGKGYGLINTAGEGVVNSYDDAISDYGTATSTPANNEVLLAYKNNRDDQYDWSYSIFKYHNTSGYWWNDQYDTDCVGLTTNFLENYYTKDGNDQTWPQVGAGSLPASDFHTRMDEMEARMRVDHYVAGFESTANPNDNTWGYGMRAAINTSSEGTVGNVLSTERGCAYPVKFYYKAGSRIWFEFPLFRVAELYLNLAEAYNERGNSSEALKYLNIIHNRAGLPNITTTDQTALRNLILREKAIEFLAENHRIFDTRHWKIRNNGIANNQIRMFQMLNNGASVNREENQVEYWDAVVYEQYWDDKMFLFPFPLTETNKGFLVQNPGY